MDISKDVDILSRVIRHRKRSLDTFIASGNLTFDTVVLDQIPSPTLVLRAAERLAAGGVLAFVLPEAYDNLLTKALGFFKHIHLFAPYDSVGKSQ